MSELKPWQYVVLGTLSGLLLSGVLLFILLRPPNTTVITIQTLQIPTNTPSPSPSPVTLRIQISGAVQKVGLYTLPEHSRLEDAILAAGGPVEDAQTELLNLADFLVDGQFIYIPYKNPEAQNNAGDPNASSGILNINLANQAQLETLPGIGATKALAIIEYRNSHGLFTNIEGLLKVNGIGPTLFARIKDLITVEP